MLDEVRRNNWAPRSVFKKAREISTAIRVVENREGRPAKDWEIAEQLDLSLSDYHRLLLEASGQSLVSFDEVGQVGESISPELSDQRWEGGECLEKDELQHLLAQNIADLPERERLVMSLYYVEELNLREVGLVLEVSESRVCQIHTQALLRLKACMEKTGDFFS
jgi:RNA polymerase sigma factor for flagellar operon FliA